MRSTEELITTWQDCKQEEDAHRLKQAKWTCDAYGILDEANHQIDEANNLLDEIRKFKRKLGV